MLAIELPAGRSSLTADEAPLHDLLMSARCPGYDVRADLPDGFAHEGAARVVWTASDPETGAVAARRSGFVFVLPAGTTPAGLSGDENASAGNNASHIVRDASGSVHMIWQDGGRPDGATGPMYRRASTAADGTVRFDTGATELAATGTGEWNAYPAIAAAGTIVHFAWQQQGSLYYRTIRRDAAGWRWTDPVNTGAPSVGRDIGPSLDIKGTTIAVVTPSGFYAESAGNGGHWSVTRLPIPPGTAIKSVSVVAERDGGALIAMVLSIRNKPSLSETQGNGIYWGLRLIRRTASGEWSALTDPLRSFPEWADPGTAGEDVVTDWVRLAADEAGGMHMTFHGTAVSRIFANDRAYYAWRDPAGTWHQPVSLHEPAAWGGFGFSYAPSLSLAGDVALPLTFYNVIAGERDLGFDSVLGQFRNGASSHDPLRVTHFTQNAIDTGEPANSLGARFPAAAPRVYYGPDGRPWLDILETLVPGGVPGAPNLIVYQRLDLTGWLRRQ